MPNVCARVASKQCHHSSSRHVTRISSAINCPQAVKLRFDYLVKKPEYLDEANRILARPISYLDFHVIDQNASIDPDDIPMRWCVRHVDALS